ncbi:hypothetical protein A5482_001230 [Cyanobacterium sp. IPPAS B-1200]|uniref:hypothetical protein n=1 Tax=Cyanobacterium sp. IPPAS B-1200 TaxID=1562720 RepID=UPI000852540C|nr:hypothetical protein [Cyanobacterium sp. IPPAS B-1200]OEJ79311.1 hypothetical protein A5482_00150 [Cyanobacterium sp. IPPAS B-1200]
MGKSIKQLRGDLTVLDTEVRLLGKELYSLYEEYIKHFTPVVAKQLVLASYQICTQKYPDSFLALSYQQKVDLQGKIKGLGKGFLIKLSNYLVEIDVPDNNLVVDFPRSLTGVIPQEVPSEVNSLQAGIQGLSAEISSGVNLFSDVLNPDDVLHFYDEIEDSLGEVLTEISSRGNDLLKEYNILPAQIPAKVLEMALKNRDNSKGIADAPNLLSLVVEKEDISSKEIKDITPVVAMCLRLGEIEFGDTGLSADRRRIVAIMDKLVDLQRRYQRITRLYAIAQAESQWRSCWSEES